MRLPIHILMVTICGVAAVLARAQAQQDSSPKFDTQERDFVVHDFHFRSGETLPEVRLHYTTLGKPARDGNGHITNAVLILHGTTGTGGQFLAPYFAGELFGPGQLLDTSRYYVILPDNLGHGKSSKPSDGMHAHFPPYDYADMVTAQHDLLVNGLGINHLRLVMGTSMGCMHAWMWGEIYPDAMDALMPLACLPVEIGGRNRIWRKMLMDAIRDDPAWKGGDYSAEPQDGLRTAMDLMLIAGSAPLAMQTEFPTRDAADAFVKRYFDEHMKQAQSHAIDANDIWYAFNASRDYDPSPNLGKITAPLMFVNFADDFINPPELGIAQREIQRVQKGKFVLIAASDKTHGHGTHTWAVFWKQYLKELLDQSQGETH
jgi:homoserine O-acetyltransferase/O-succinyltransferase